MPEILQYGRKYFPQKNLSQNGTSSFNENSGRFILAARVMGISGFLVRCPEGTTRVKEQPPKVSQPKISLSAPNRLIRACEGTVVTCKISFCESWCC